MINNTDVPEQCRKCVKLKCSSRNKRYTCAVLRELQPDNVKCWARETNKEAWLHVLEDIKCYCEKSARNHSYTFDIKREIMDFKNS